MSELKPCPYCEAELFAGTNVHHKSVMRHPYNPSCPLSEATWIDSPGFRDRWNRRAAPANEPLTLEQLKQMDGEPVWCVEKQEWMLYRASVDRLSDGEYMFVPDNLTVFAHKPVGGERE